MNDIIIIGSGIFGCIIAKQLRAKGRKVLIIDNSQPQAASKAAACLMKPSWFSSMDKEAYIPAMGTLENLYTIQEIEFQTKIKKTKVKWIDPITILNDQESVQSKVISISKNAMGWTIATEKISYSAFHIILAAGIWCNEILFNSALPPVPNLFPQTGTSFKISGVVTPKIHIWRPYKQLVSFNIAPSTIWIGDGHVRKDYDDTDISKSQQRCAEFLEVQPTQLYPFTGHRPYVRKAKPCYLEQHASQLWVITGGAKNGTIAAGWAAHEISRRLGC